MNARSGAALTIFAKLLMVCRLLLQSQKQEVGWASNDVVLFDGLMRIDPLDHYHAMNVLLLAFTCEFSLCR